MSEAQKRSATTASAPLPREGILDIAPYEAGKSAIAGHIKPIKLSSNESPFGPSPKALEAFAAAAKDLVKYPEGSARVLRAAIGGRYGLDPDRIVAGAGSDDVLMLLGHAYLAPGDEVIFSTHTFTLYRIIALTAGAVPRPIEERHWRADVDAMIAAMSERTRMIYLANPDNPTGTYVDAAGIDRLIAALPERALLVLDGAYAEYATMPDFPDGFALVDRHPNVVATRTYSKIHGLAGLRLGWGYMARDIADVLHRIRGPFNVSGPGLAAGIAAIEDVAFETMVRDHTIRWRDWLTQAIGGLGLEVVPSAANFVLVAFPSTPGRTAGEADAFLQLRGIIVRRLTKQGLPDALRITVGLEDENRLVVDVLADFLKTEDRP